MCAYSGTLLSLAAILYVDDSDLLNLARSSETTDNEFFQDVQQATMDWEVSYKPQVSPTSPPNAFDT